MYRPNEPFNVNAELFEVTKTVVKGVTKKVSKSLGFINCSFKSFGGTEQIVNGLYSVIDTAEIITWYRPEIKASGQLVIDNKTYEILGSPENIDMRNQYMKFKVKCISGGA